MLLGCSTGTIKSVSTANKHVKGKSINNKIIINDTTTTFGPENNSFHEIGNFEKEKLTGVYLGTALSDSYLYPKMLKLIEEQGEKIGVIYTDSFSIVVGLLYAEFKDLNRIEWELHKLNDGIKHYKPYSDKWLKQIDKYLSKTFNERKIIEMNPLVVFMDGITELSMNQTVRSYVVNNLNRNQNEWLIKWSKKPFINLSDYGLNSSYYIQAYSEKLSLYYQQEIILAAIGDAQVKRRDDKQFIKIKNNVEYVDYVINVSDVFVSATEDVAKLLQNDHLGDNE
jgi:hypothetical protein